MNTNQITPERIAESIVDARERVADGELPTWSEHRAIVYLADALESSRAEVQRLTEEARRSPSSPQPSADVVTVPRELFKQLRDNCEATLVEVDISAFRKEYRAGLLQRADDALRSSTNHDAQDAGEGR